MRQNTMFVLLGLLVISLMFGCTTGKVYTLTDTEPHTIYNVINGFNLDHENLVIVMGESSDAAEIMAASSLVTGITGGAGEVIPTFLPDDSDFESQSAGKNLIIIGNSNVNTLTKEYLLSLGRDSWSFASGESVILLDDSDHSGLIKLYIAGTTSADTENAVNVLNSYTSYTTGLGYKTVLVSGTPPQLSDLPIITVERFLPASMAVGQEATINLVISRDRSLFGVTENFPEGWQFVSATPSPIENNPPDNTVDRTMTWAFGGPFPNVDVITYKVIPMTSGIASFTGNWETVGPVAQEAVLGDLSRDVGGAVCTDADSDGYDACSDSASAIPMIGCSDPCDTIDSVEDCAVYTGSEYDYCTANLASINPGAAETCNGIDDNSDTIIDNSDPIDTCDKDADGALNNCFSNPDCIVDCDDNDPARFPGNSETCDGKDNDCDGIIDSFTTTSGCEQRGVCSGSARTCTAEAFSVCSILPAEESCDAGLLDEDCDGSSNEGCACSQGQSQSCNVGGCTGTQTCDLSGQWSECGVTPVTEVCYNGADEDCDGVIDNGCASIKGIIESVRQLPSESKNLKIVIGANAATSDNIGAIEIAAITGVGTVITDLAATEDENYIIVGGPCANRLAGELLGKPWSGSTPDPTCTDGFTDGQGKIQLSKTATDKDRMLVAGYSALDTRKAARAISKYNSVDIAPNLQGGESIVTGASLSSPAFVVG